MENIDAMWREFLQTTAVAAFNEHDLPSGSVFITVAPVDVTEDIVSACDVPADADSDMHLMTAWGVNVEFSEFGEWFGSPVHDDTVVFAAWMTMRYFDDSLGRHILSVNRPPNPDACWEAVVFAAATDGTRLSGFVTPDGFIPNDLSDCDCSACEVDLIGTYFLNDTTGRFRTPTGMNPVDYVANAVVGFENAAAHNMDRLHEIRVVSSIESGLVHEVAVYLTGNGDQFQTTLTRLQPPEGFVGVIARSECFQYSQAVAAEIPPGEVRHPDGSPGEFADSVDVSVVVAFGRSHNSTSAFCWDSSMLSPLTYDVPDDVAWPDVAMRKFAGRISESMFELCRREQAPEDTDVGQMIQQLMWPSRKPTTLVSFGSFDDEDPAVALRRATALYALSESDETGHPPVEGIAVFNTVNAIDSGFDVFVGRDADIRQMATAAMRQHVRCNDGVEPELAYAFAEASTAEADPEMLRASLSQFAREYAGFIAGKLLPRGAGYVAQFSVHDLDALVDEAFNSRGGGLACMCGDQPALSGDCGCLWDMLSEEKRKVSFWGA